VGVVLAILQQWCGINVIFNYADEIFTQAGYGINDMLFNIVATGGVSLVFTFVGMALIDRLGRRKLMLFGFGGLSLLFLIFGLFYQLHFQGLIMLISVLTGIAIYAMTLAPTTWVVLSEIFPNKVRGNCHVNCHARTLEWLFYFNLFIPCSQQTCWAIRYFLVVWGHLCVWLLIYTKISTRNQG
jgi:MFS family permease